MPPVQLSAVAMLAFFSVNIRAKTCAIVSLSKLIIAFGITALNITNWNTAYGWGNHALAGYALDTQVVHVTGAETVAGLKTFTSAVKAPNFVLSGGTGNTGMYFGHTDRLVLANYGVGGIDFESNGGDLYDILNGHCRYWVKS